MTLPVFLAARSLGRPDAPRLPARTARGDYAWSDLPAWVRASVQAAAGRPHGLRLWGWARSSTHAAAVLVSLPAGRGQQTFLAAVGPNGAAVLIPVCPGTPASWPALRIARPDPQTAVGLALNRLESVKQWDV